MFIYNLWNKMNYYFSLFFSSLYLPILGSCSEGDWSWQVRSVQQQGEHGGRDQQPWPDPQHCVRQPWRQPLPPPPGEYRKKNWELEKLWPEWHRHRLPLFKLLMEPKIPSIKQWYSVLSGCQRGHCPNWIRSEASSCQSGEVVVLKDFTLKGVIFVGLSDNEEQGNCWIHDWRSSSHSGHEWKIPLVSGLGLRSTGEGLVIGKGGNRQKSFISYLN